MDQAGARSTNVVSNVGGFGTKSTRSASAYLTLRPGSEAGWSITSGRLESGSEASVGAREETTTKRADFAILPLGEGPIGIGTVFRTATLTMVASTSNIPTQIGGVRPGLG